MVVAVYKRDKQKLRLRSAPGQRFRDEPIGYEYAIAFCRGASGCGFEMNTRSQMDRMTAYIRPTSRRISDLFWSDLGGGELSERWRHQFGDRRRFELCTRRVLS